MMTAKVCRDLFLPLMEGLSARKVSSNTVADSVCEVEYVAASDAAKEAVWLRKFITELEVAPSLVGQVLLYCDSSGAIAQMKELKAYQRTKHILHRYHLFEKSWIKVTSTFRRSTKRRT